MNRLWVRLSLAFAAVVIVVMVVIGGAVRLAFAGDANLSGDDVPPEVKAYLEEVRQERFPLDITTVLVIVGLVAIGAGVWMSRTLTAPLQELGQAAEAIGEQELSRRVRLRGTTEVKSLALQFNEMAVQLAAAESLRRNLLADVSHELRHPLHVIQGNLQAILDDLYPLSKEEILLLSDQTHHLSSLVDDLYELAQAEAHQLPLNRQETDAAALVKAAADPFKPAAAAAAIDLQVELLGAIPTILVDPDRVRQVIANLLNNALRHTPAGGRILISVERRPPYLAIDVADSGAGIAPEHLDHVFDRFYRADSARRRDEGGTGLGLAVVKAIVEAHDGQVSAASPGPNGGTTMTVLLPA